MSQRPVAIVHSSNPVFSTPHDDRNRRLIVLLAGLLIGGVLGFVVAIVIGVALVAAWSHLKEHRTPVWRRAGRA
jgi:uncharacterized membrane protein YccC